MQNVKICFLIFYIKHYYFVIMEIKEVINKDNW